MKTVEDLEFGIPEEIEKYTAHSAEIAIMILNFILSTGMNKKEFAELVGKTSSDVTRWISGSHNFTIQTLSLIEVKTGMQVIRNLSDANRKKHLRGEAFKNPTEKELYSELMSRYLDLQVEVKRLRTKKLEELHEKISMSMSNFCWVRKEKAEMYFSMHSSDRFSTPVEQSIVQLNLSKDRRIKGHREDINLVVRAHEK